MLKVVLLLLATTVFAQDEFVTGKDVKLSKVAYFRMLFGHVHRNPSRYSNSLSTLSCGHPVKVFEISAKGSKEKTTVINGDWNYVQVGPYKGYMMISHLTDKRPTCMQDQYPRFFDSVGLELTDMYYWGKLNDQYISGRSRVR